MHILFTSDYLDLDNLGGAGRVVVEVAQRLAAAGHRVSLLAGGPRAARETVEIDGAAIERIAFPYRTETGRGLRFFFQSRAAMRRAYRSLPALPEVIVHNQPLSAAAVGNTGVPAIYIFHSPWPLEYLAERFGEESYACARSHGPRTRIDVEVRRHLEARALGRIERVITLSQSMRRHAMEIHGIPAERISVFPGGVDQQRFTPVVSEGRRQQLRQRLGIAAHELLLVTVRRLIPRTGIDLLLEALALGCQRLARARLLVAGTGPTAADLERRSRSLGIADRVRFLGYVPDAELADLYRAADITVMPTRALEGFGLSTLESLASGTPVIATPLGGSVEILEELDPALLADEVSSRAIAAALSEWCSPRAPLAALRDRCRPFVESRYTWEPMTRGIEHLAAELTGTLVTV